MPVHILQRERLISNAERKLLAEFGRQPTVEEIAAEATLPEKQVQEVLNAARTVTSLDRPVGEDETAFGELFESDVPPPDELVEISLQRDALRQAVAELPPSEQEVVRLRYGIEVEEPKTIDEVVRTLGISRERVRRIEREALARLGRARELEGFQAGSGAVVQGGDFRGRKGS
jgi:RNA polymerase primary sigma factor